MRFHPQQMQHQPTIGVVQTANSNHNNNNINNNNFNNNNYNQENSIDNGNIVNEQITTTAIPTRIIYDNKLLITTTTDLHKNHTNEHNNINDNYQQNHNINWNHNTKSLITSKTITPNTKHQPQTVDDIVAVATETTNFYNCNNIDDDINDNNESNRIDNLNQLNSNDSLLLVGENEVRIICKLHSNFFFYIFRYIFSSMRRGED